MDGTLLNDNKEISKNNIEGLKKIIKIGVNVAIVTGRQLINAKHFASQIGEDIPIISLNGALIYHPKGGILYKKPLQKENVISIINMIKENKMNPQFYSDTSVFSEKLEYSALYISNINQKAEEQNRVNINIIPKFDEIIKNYQGEFLKCIMIDEDIEKIRKLKDKIKTLKNVEVVSSFPNNFEVMEKGVSKGNSIAILSNYLSISKEEIVAIGDNENDISMVSSAGLFIAMENATEELKKYANEITLSNNQDGVNFAINEFILK